MLSFLFWNLNGNNPVDRTGAMRVRLGRLAETYDVDVFVFVEPAFGAAKVVDLLNAAKVGRYSHSKSECRKVQIFHRLSESGSG